MSKIKSMLIAMAGFAMALEQPKGIPVTTDEDLLEIKRRQDKNRTLRHDEIKRANGLFKFEYPKGDIWAINQKVADKKATKKGWMHK